VPGGYAAEVDVDEVAAAAFEQRRLRRPAASRLGGSRNPRARRHGVDGRGRLRRRRPPARAQPPRATQRGDRPATRRTVGGVPGRVRRRLDRAGGTHGRGPSACSVGALAEFGARTDPAAAHLIRLVGSPARPLHRGRSARGRGPRAHAPRGHRDGLLRRARPRRRRHHKVVASVPGEDVSESREHPGQRSLGEALDVVAVHDPAVVGDEPVLVAGCRAVQHGSASANVTGGSGGGVAPTTKSS
jgi:hypothetical protein